jgi:hypothetical protein
MRRIFTLVSVVAVLLALAGALSIRRGPGALAQDSTQQPGVMQVAPGVMAEEIPSQPGRPTVYRLRLAPGASFTADKSESAVSLIYIESGSITATFGGPIGVNRGASPSQPAEQIAAGVAFTANAGDFFIAPPHTAVEVHTNGSAPASILVAAVIPPIMGTPVAAAGAATPALGG